MTAVVNIATFTDADYAQAFRQKVGTSDYYDFTDHTLLMMVRRAAEDSEVLLSLVSTIIGIPPDESGIDIYQGDDLALSMFSVVIRRLDLQRMPRGVMVQSLIVVSPDGLHRDLWRGTFTNTAGPTR